MKRRLALLFPYLCVAFVVASVAVDTWIVTPAPRATSTALGGSEADMPACHREAMDAASTSGSAPTAGAAAMTGMDHGGHHMGFDGIPAPLYYSSIAIVLLVSFVILEGRDRSSRLPRPRLDLLRSRRLRSIVVHPVTRPLLQGLVVACFVLIIAAGLFGSQLPTKNIAPLLTWTIWWCGLVALILYAGKAWCYVCPWDAIAGWAEGNGRFGLGLPWPKSLRNIWPATLLFVGLTWLELGVGVTDKPRATAYLALLMLGLAFGSAFLFERKSFCRYACLVGRVSGLYALFSPVEVRARDRDVCRGCTTHSCYHGNERGAPCPTFQFLGGMRENTYCIACMECVKTCEADNVALNLRPWGEDLVQHRKARPDEAYLALIMLSLTGFHGLTMTGSWSTMIDGMKAALGIGEPFAFTLGMAMILAGPVLLYAALVALSRRFAGVGSRRYREHFVRYAYAMLPIALFYHLAHNSEHLLLEGQRLIAMVSDPFGHEWNLLGTATWVPGPLVGMQTLWLVQVLLVLTGHVYGLWAARNAARALYADHRAATRSQLPMLAAMILFSMMSLWLLKQPMQMRMSWM